MKFSTSLDPVERFLGGVSSSFDSPPELRGRYLGGIIVA
jgi:hypothetical protein